jgi:hypothetical protein
MNIDAVLRKLNERQVAYLLIGGVNFMLLHQPITTGDIDVWIEDSDENRKRCEQTLAELGAEWGPTESDWGPVAARAPGWLERQGMFCLSTPLAVFRSVAGLSSWQESRGRAIQGMTKAGTPFFGISDQDMLKCQLALNPEMQKQDRIRYLQSIIETSDE